MDKLYDQISDFDSNLLTRAYTKQSVDLHAHNNDIVTPLQQSNLLGQFSHPVATDFLKACINELCILNFVYTIHSATSNGEHQTILFFPHGGYLEIKHKKLDDE